MTTIVYFDGVPSRQSTSRIFRIIRPRCTSSLLVKSFQNGIATVEPYNRCSLQVFAQVIAGCFDCSSNFDLELRFAYGLNSNSVLTGIEFSFEGVNFLVTAENATVDKICNTWHEKNSQK